METANPSTDSLEAAAAIRPKERDPVAAPAARAFDFRHPVFLSSPEWRRLKMEVEEFVESLGALLSTYLRLDLSLQLGKLETVNFNEFTSSISARTHLTLFKLEPLRGISVFEVRSGIALAIVDRLLGGPGSAATLERNLTDMEIALLDQFVQIVLGEWSKQWKKFQELRPEILGHENNGKFLQSSSGETVMLVLRLEVRMGECVDQIQLAFPYGAIEPLVQKLNASLPSPPPTPAATQTSGLKWNRRLDALPLNMTAHWADFKMTARALMALQPGEIIELKPEAAEHLELRVGKVVKFKGRLGSRENRRAVQITEVCKI
jgi:flagellar motor switch protein FliM